MICAVTTACFYDGRCLTHDNGSMVLDEHASRWLDVPLPAGSGDAGYLLAWDGDRPQASPPTCSSSPPARTRPRVTRSPG